MADRAGFRATGSGCRPAGPTLHWLAQLLSGCTAQEILDHADELAARFEQTEPHDLRDAVVQARADGHSWAAIGAMVGTSGEAARQRYGHLLETG